MVAVFSILKRHAVKMQLIIEHMHKAHITADLEQKRLL